MSSLLCAPSISPKTKVYSVDLIDVGIDKLTISGIIHRIIEVDAQIVGISSFIANHGNGLKIAHEIKKQFGSQVKVMMGGPQASFVYEEVLKQGDVDIVSIFEGEQTIVELLNCIKTGGDLKKIAGIAFVNEEGEVIKTERRLPIQDLDTIDFPAWDLFKIDKYQEPGIVLTGRGCPYKCIFCSAGAIAGGRYRMRSVKNVVDEIEMLYKTYGIKKIFIADDTFTASEKHCIEICREIRNRNLDIAWQAEARANTVTDLVAAEMAKAGCHHVQIGAESGDNEILKKIGKNVTTDTIERAVRIFLKHGITVVCSFILGHPDDTAETCEKTIRFGKYLKTISGGYTSCKFAILTPLPGIVIMYFDKEMVKKGTFKTIVQVKGRLGQRIPILTLMEEGTPQNIFSTLMAGAYDYLEIAKSSEEYRKKIEDIARWNWYLGKYGLKEK